MLHLVRVEGHRVLKAERRGYLGYVFEDPVVVIAIIEEVSDLVSFVFVVGVVIRHHGQVRRDHVVVKVAIVMLHLRIRVVVVWHMMLLLKVRGVGR